MMFVPPDIDGIGSFFETSCGSTCKILGSRAVTVSTITVILDVSVPPVAEFLIVKLTVELNIMCRDFQDKIS